MIFGNEAMRNLLDINRFRVHKRAIDRFYFTASNSVSIISKKPYDFVNARAIHAIHCDNFCDDWAPTTQLPTWRVTGTLNPVIGGVGLVVTVPPAATISAPSPASPSLPGAVAAPQTPAQGL